MTAGRTRRVPAPGRIALALGAVVASAVVAAPPAAAQQEFVTVTFDSATLGDLPGTVVVTGTVTCGSPVEAFVFGDVAQVQGLDIARDFFGVPVQCSPTPASWSATSLGALRVFLPLEATITVNAQYCTDEVTCFDDSNSQTVELAPPADGLAPLAVDR